MTDYEILAARGRSEFLNMPWDGKVIAPFWDNGKSNGRFRADLCNSLGMVAVKFAAVLADLARNGATPWEHFLWGGVHPNWHGSALTGGSWHTGGGGADINFDSHRLEPQLMESIGLGVIAAHDMLGFVKWWGPNHYDHLHIQCGSYGNYLNDALSDVNPTPRNQLTLMGLDWRKPLTICYGMSGPMVGHLQNIIGVTVDDEFGDKTLKGLCDWQHAHKLSPDGLAGPMTWRELITAKPIRPGERNSSVWLWQYITGAHQDGSHGPRSVGLTRTAQWAHGITQDACVGPQTVKAVIK